MKIASNGQMKYCRWSSMTGKVTEDTPVIGDVHPLTFFQKNMSQERKAMLDGQPLDDCNDCYVMEKYHKVSGRQKQLLKTGITTDNFAKSCISSPFAAEFEKSLETGQTDLVPLDWQIDLGNHCNSACVMCAPASSSRLAAEFHRIGFIDRLPVLNWTEDSSRVDLLIDVLSKTSDLAYLHFVGGETLITPGFKKILRALMKHEFRHNITVGLTTNLTVWDAEINHMLGEFKQVNLGMSIDSMTQVNDYVRYPSDIQSVTALLNRWIELSRKHNWIPTIRTTPTALTAGELLDIYKFASQSKVGIESCNFLDEPQVLRMSVLPLTVRQQISNQLQHWLQDQKIDTETVINNRDPNHVQQSILQDAVSYVNYLDQCPDETHLLPAMMQYLKKLDQSRGNCVLDYLPEYEELFRSAGY
jgi:sulfatase maturation enzyme AslB (radical SAM superfamily)